MKIAHFKVDKDKRVRRLHVWGIHFKLTNLNSLFSNMSDSSFLDKIIINQAFFL